MSPPSTLSRDISPPPSRKSSSTLPTNEPKSNSHGPERSKATAETPTLAAIEAGEAEIRDHLAYFSEHLSEASRQTHSAIPRISIEDFQSIYKRNEHRHGHHFVVHQHDHPISGSFTADRPHSIARLIESFAVPYGLPGNPQSIRPNRMAIETRVHNLWNNLIESASHATGSLLIWDTGEYEILPYRDQIKGRTTDDELSDGSSDAAEPELSESQKLFAGFQTRHLRLRLHGTKLPKNYTIGLRLPSANDRNDQPKRPKRKRRRIDPAKALSQRAVAQPTTDSEDEGDAATAGNDETGENDDEVDDAGVASEEEDEDAVIRSNNAYTGATNTIGSVHQRHWFLSLDRKNSGFRKARSGPEEGRWIDGWDPFFVLGRDEERSVVTGRNADEVMADEGVKKFVGRKMWRPIIE